MLQQIEDLKNAKTEDKQKDAKAEKTKKRRERQGSDSYFDDDEDEEMNDGLGGDVSREAVLAALNFDVEEPKVDSTGVIDQKQLDELHSLLPPALRAYTDVQMKSLMAKLNTKDREAHQLVGVLNMLQEKVKLGAVFVFFFRVSHF